jgi:hypothetical protein
MPVPWRKGVANLVAWLRAERGLSAEPEAKRALRVGALS